MKMATTKIEINKIISNSMSTDNINCKQDPERKLDINLIDDDDDKSNEQSNEQSSNIKFDLYVIDTVCAFESDAKDELNEMIQVCNNIGGINAFLLFFKLGSIIDSTKIRLLKKYNQIFGDMFWNHVVVVITHYERNKPADIDVPEEMFINGTKRYIKRINQVLNKISNNKFNEKNELCIITFGKNEKEWKQSVLNLFLNLYNDYSTKYTAFTRQTPMDKLVNEMEKIQSQLADIQGSAKEMSKEMDQLRNIFKK